ncbi:MAG TPA: ATP-binding protein [Rhodospirillales bacterium]|nr:ATP-binding protein [Rhodospirillales bacterium]
MGLAIAREIVRAHGGELSLAHTGPDGTVFRLELPARQPRAADAAPA